MWKIVLFIFAAVLLWAAVAEASEKDTTYRPGDRIGVRMACNDSDFMAAVGERMSTEMLKEGVKRGICVSFDPPLPAILVRWVSGHYESDGQMYSHWQLILPGNRYGFIILGDGDGPHRAAERL